MKVNLQDKDFKKLALGVAGIGILFLVWEICARMIAMPIALPTFSETAAELFRLMGTIGFWRTIAISSLRIFLGFTVGIILGSSLALLTHFLWPIDGLISPIMTIMRSTPVASFVIVLWFVIQLIFGYEWPIPVVLITIMVAPIIWQNLKDGFNAIDKQLLEVCRVFRVSEKKKLRFLILPTLKKYFIPGVISSIGLAWKSGIAAEIIAYTPSSIGYEIYWAKSFSESPTLLAWTVAVILLSLLFECIITMLRRVKKWR